MEENATKPQNILLVMLQQGTAETKIAGNLMLKNGDYFVNTEDEILDVGQHMYVKVTKSGSAAYS
jgi:hypothetical protein